MATFVPDPKDTVLDHELNPDQYDLKNDEAREHVQKNEFIKAAMLYSECINLCPDRATGYTNRALCYLRLNMPLDAENDCTKALQKEPSNVKALYRRGQARKALKKYGDSLSDFDRLLEIDPSSEYARTERKWLIHHLHAQIQQSTTSQPQPSFSSISAAVSQPSLSGISGDVRQPSLSTWSSGVLQSNPLTVNDTAQQTSVSSTCGNSSLPSASRSGGIISQSSTSTMSGAGSQSGTSTVTATTKRSRWTCSVCEFENESHLNVCYFCETTRNVPKPSTELFTQHTINTPTREQSQTDKSQEEQAQAPAEKFAQLNTENKTKSSGVEEIRDQDQKTNQKRKLNTESEKTPSERKRRKEKCGKCLACTRSDCTECRFCLDKKKYGGTGQLKQGCEKRRCLYAMYPIDSNRDEHPREQVQQLNDQTSLKCCNIPAEMNNKSDLESHFSKFGKVINVKPNAKTQSAIIHFENHVAAAAAKESKFAGMNFSYYTRKSVPSSSSSSSFSKEHTLEHVQKPSDKTSLKCCNVPAEINNKADLENHFSKFGKVKSVKPNTKTQSAIIHFEDHIAAVAAKETKFAGIIISYYTRKAIKIPSKEHVQQLSDKTSLKCCNVPAEMNNKTDLVNHFSKFGKVESVKPNTKTQSAIIHFEDHIAAVAAKETKFAGMIISYYTRKAIKTPSKEHVQQPSDKTSLKCCNVPAEMNNKTDLVNHFSKFGKVESVKPNTKTQSAIIHFEDHIAAIAAKETKFAGIIISYYTRKVFQTPSKEYDKLQIDRNKTSIKCFNVPSQMNNVSDLKAHFSKFGRVKKVTTNSKTKSAFIHFESHEEAAGAQKTRFGGMRIFLYSKKTTKIHSPIKDKQDESQVDRCKTLIQCFKIPLWLNNASDLKGHFSQFGGVKKVIPNTKMDSAIIHFETHDAAAAAQKKEFAGMKLKWHLRKSTKGIKPSSKEDLNTENLMDEKTCTSIKCSNIQDEMNNIVDLEWYFKKFGEVKEVVCNKESKSAIVNFENHEEAVAATSSKDFGMCIDLHKKSTKAPTGAASASTEAAKHRDQSKEDGKKTSIWCSNVPSWMNNASDLKVHFEKFGGVKKVFPNAKKDTAIIHFENHAASHGVSAILCDAGENCDKNDLYTLLEKSFNKSGKGRKPNLPPIPSTNLICLQFDHMRMKNNKTRKWMCQALSELFQSYPSQRFRSILSKVTEDLNSMKELNENTILEFFGN